MGNMIIVSVLTDGLDQILKHPVDVVNAIDDGGIGLSRNGISSRSPGHFGNVTTYPIGNHGNVMAVQRCHHADDMNVVMSWHNSLIPLDYDTELEYLKMAKRHIESCIKHIKAEMKNKVASIK